MNTGFLLKQAQFITVTNTSPSNPGLERRGVLLKKNTNQQQTIRAKTNKRNQKTPRLQHSCSTFSFSNRTEEFRDRREICLCVDSQAILKYTFVILGPFFCLFCFVSFCLYVFNKSTQQTCKQRCVPWTRAAVSFGWPLVGLNFAAALHEGHKAPVKLWKTRTLVEKTLLLSPASSWAGEILNQNVRLEWKNSVWLVYV